MSFVSKIKGLFKSNKGIDVLSPVDGNIVETKEVKDETFSQDLIGKGFGVLPSNTIFCSPYDGEITLCEGHAISIRHDSGIETLIHIGIDTVKINADQKQNEPFKVFKHIVRVGEKVKAGQKIMEAEINEIVKLGLSPMTPVVVLSDSLKGKHVKLIATGEVKQGTPVLKVK